MSLARSLLALVALFAACHAQAGCSARSLLIGRQTQNQITLPSVYVPPPGGRLRIPNNCEQRGRWLAGELIQVCNRNPYGSAPSVYASNPSDLRTAVYVTCTDGCPYGATANVVQYCL